jgi:hypothetical protein
MTNPTTSESIVSPIEISVGFATLSSFASTRRREPNRDDGETCWRAKLEFD